MMNNNKILTVSYGTFSCTLEGFDDSFGTMKAIAEYFRDLSSEDRYFGAEPAQPDAEMLAHIAQKEISRRVEARQQDGQIVLSAQTPEEPAAPAQPAPAPEAAAPPKAPAAPQPQVSSSAAGPSVVSTSFAPRRPKEISAYYDAYRINALKSAEPVTAPEAAPAPQAEAAAPRDEVVSRDVAAPKPEATQAKAAPASAAPAPEASAPEVDIVPGQPDEDVEAFFADSPRNEVTVDDQDAEIQPVAAPVVDSIAAKLQRIRAVVANQDAPAAPQPQVFDDEDTTDAEASTDDVIANAINDIQGALDADDTVEDIAQSSDLEAEAEEDVAAAQESEEQHEDVAADEVEEADAAQVDADETGEAEEDTAPRGRVLKVKRADIDRAIAEGELEEVEEDAPAVLEEPEKPALRIQRDPESTLSDEDEEDLARELAELEATLSSAAADTLTDAPEDAEEAVADEDDAPEEETAEEDSQEDTAQEEALDTDVSEDDAEEVQAETETAAEPEAEAPKAAPQRRSLPTLDADSGPDMNRLLAETDNQMDEPEAATRRDAITHLRAAVAAKKADMALGAPDAAERENNAYRSDLAEVVKPRRPASTTARTERPAEPRPAPLKLVAAQRIDTDQPRNVAPVRPRRVAAVAPAPVPQAGGFAEFAEEMGATQLPDLLEAAAAYMAFVEGMDDFSRPQLMNTVRQGGAEDFSREEGLRSFGQLLRTGKLQKLEGGRFKASEQIGFQPDARAAG
ncbi:hypothetical protein [Sulfitobacter pontiacus]|uniref:hypothetical protein n=2 Tax=Sulfitobacter pontiacus TaxID=60137 RepID=UPI003264AC70